MQISTRFQQKERVPPTARSLPSFKQTEASLPETLQFVEAMVAIQRLV